MKNRKRMISILAGIMAAVMVLTLVFSLIPMKASASSTDIRNQINQLKKEKEEIGKKIEEVKGQYQQNEDEIADIIAKKNVIDQEIQLLNTQVMNINEQIVSFNALIADKQDELDNAETRYLQMNQENKVRIRAMEEEGEISYWEVLFKANSFSDLLDRLNMVEEIADSDARRLKEMGEAAAAVEQAQTELEGEKADLEETKRELNETQAQMDSKRAEADALLQELLVRADDLTALEEEFEKQDAEFVKQISAMEVAYTAAKQAEWAAYVAAQKAAQEAQGGQSTTSGGSTGGKVMGDNGWMWPTSTHAISSPYGNREAPNSMASTNHQGIDIDGKTGDAVWAARPGIVTTGYSQAAGNYIKIDHQDGFSSIYMHLDSISVTSGTIVGAGDNIGAMGASGNATGDHLHFGISYQGVPVNPSAYVS